MEIISRDRLLAEVTKYVIRDLTEAEQKAAPALDASDEEIGGFLANEILDFLLVERGYTVVDLNTKVEEPIT